MRSRGQPGVWPAFGRAKNSLRRASRVRNFRTHAAKSHMGCFRTGCEEPPGLAASRDPEAGRKHVSLRARQGAPVPSAGLRRPVDPQGRARSARVWGVSAERLRSTPAGGTAGDPGRRIPCDDLMLYVAPRPLTACLLTRCHSAPGQLVKRRVSALFRLASARLPTRPPRCREQQ
jgi:hypothetical protein